MTCFQINLFSKRTSLTIVKYCILQHCRHELIDNHVLTKRVAVFFGTGPVLSEYCLELVNYSKMTELEDQEIDPYRYRAPFC